MIKFKCTLSLGCAGIALSPAPVLAREFVLQLTDNISSIDIRDQSPGKAPHHFVSLANDSAIVGSSGLKLISDAGSTSAIRQEIAPPSEDTATASDSFPGKKNSTESREGASVNEIVVTAQRREQRLQDVPVAVSVVTPDALTQQGIQSAQFLTQAVPGLVMDKFGGNSIPSIRGVTTLVGVPASSPNVAVYIDGIYQPSGQSNDFKFADLERIEVLKGPQGTLYGRNATGGAISVVTKAPSFQPTGMLAASYGSFDTVEASGFVSGPIAEGAVAGSLSASYYRSDGYIDDILRGGSANESEWYQFRGKLLFEPSENWSFQIGAHYYHLDDPTVFAGFSRNGNTVGQLFGALVADEPNTYSGNDLSYNKNLQYGVNAKLVVDLGFATLTSTTAQIWDDQTYVSDGDRSSAPVVVYVGTVDEQKAFQQEIILTSDGMDGFSWLLGGGYYYKDTFSLLDIPQSGGNTFGVYNLSVNRAGSVFGEGALPIFDGLTLIAGLRFTTEKVKISGLNGINPPTSMLPFQGASSYKKLTPRLTLQYKFNPQTMLYATYSQGFKSGLYDRAAFATVDPETLSAYQLGLKAGEILGNISLNIESFFYDYKDQQVQSQVTIAGQPLSFTTNAAKSEIYGVDGTVEIPLTSLFELSSGFSYLHTKILDFPNAVVTTPTGNGGNVNTILSNAKGNVLPRSPKFTLSTTAKYRNSFYFGDLDFSATVYHSTKIYYEYSNRFSQPSYTTLDASAGWTSPDEHWRFILTGRNLTGEDYIVATFITPVVDSINTAPPRSITAKLEYRF